MKQDGMACQTQRHQELVTLCSHKLTRSIRCRESMLTIANMQVKTLQCTRKAEIHRLNSMKYLKKYQISRIKLTMQVQKLMESTKFQLQRDSHLRYPIEGSRVSMEMFQD